MKEKGTGFMDVYSGKEAGRDFRNHLKSCMSFLDFKLCLDDPDEWMRPAVRADDDKHYEHILIYAYDALVVS